ncbi:MAG: zinc ribbon domain-containing protein, partial [Bacilli bacterium]|nr:zinc ribbon domain-containing protein [Bacilli bacterium]
ENSDSTPIVPVIEIEEPVIELNIAEESAEESNEEENDESKVEEVEEKPIPVITEEEPVLNLGDESSAEEIATPEMEEEQSITPIIEEESNDIRLVNENDEYNIESNEEATIAVEESEEPVIMLSNDNTDTEEITPFEPSFEVPQISEETPEEVEVESEEGAEEVTEEVEDISVPEFDFQSFMMTNDNDNGLDYENPTVVESQTETATYISDPTPTKFCSNCGVMLTDESSICPSCGEPID